MMNVGFEDSPLPYATTDDELSTLTPDDFVKAPLHHVVIRYSELDENSTRYERLIAAPGENDMQIMWLGWTLVTGVCGFIVFVVFTSLCLSKPSRSKPFNLYLLFLMVPDLLLSVLCCWTCLENYLLGHYSSFWMCHFQSFYCIFSIAANAWLNAVVCYQLHIMLRCAGKFQRYKPPTTRQVVIHAMCVYLWSIFVASWTLWELVLPNADSWWPHKTLLVGGVECLPMDFGVASTAFFYCVLFPCLMGIPLVYTLYLLYVILSNNRLPPVGKRRQLVIYFFRLVMVFVVMWTPGLVFIFMTGDLLNPWVKWVGGTWCHVQGAASAIASLWKPDVYNAVKELLNCRVWRYYTCCRRFYISDHKLQDPSTGLSSLRFRRNGSFSSAFSWGSFSLLGGFGRRDTQGLSTFVSGQSLATGTGFEGSSTHDMAPFGSCNINIVADASMKDQSVEQGPFSSGSLLDLTQPQEDHSREQLCNDKEDHLEQHQPEYSDDASAHLEDEYNPTGHLQYCDPRAVDLEEQHTFVVRRAALVPQMIDTTSNEEASADDRSLGLSLEDDDDDDDDYLQGNQPSSWLESFLTSQSVDQTKPESGTETCDSSISGCCRSISGSCRSWSNQVQDYGTETSKRTAVVRRNSI